MAGKAESFLNQMDQTAAAALSGSMSETSASASGLMSSTTDSILSNDKAAVIPHLVTYQPRYTPTPVSATIASPHSRNSSIGSSFSTVSSSRDFQPNGHVVHSIFTSTPNPSHKSSKSRPDLDDEKIFDFINSKSDSTTSKPVSVRTTSPRRSDEEQSIASIEVVSVSSDEGRAAGSTSGKGSPDGSEGGKSDFMNEPEATTTTSGMEKVDHLPVSQNNAPGINLELDDKERKEVIASLEKEIFSLTQRNVAAETEIKRLSKRLENWQYQLSASDSSLRELQALEEDLRSAIQVRDESISILKVRLQESDDLLKAKTESIESLQLQYDLLAKENSKAQSSLDQDIVSMQNRIKELEHELLTGKESFQKSQSDSMMQIGMLEENNRVLVDEIGTLQRDLRSEKNHRKDAEKQVKQLKSTFDSLAAEFEEYKSKAVKTLQSKEDLIRGLQRKSNEGDEGIADTNDFQVDFEESNKQTLVLQSQCDSLVQEVQDLQAKNESLKTELDRLKQEDLEEMTTSISSLNDELEGERRSKNEMENELRQLQEELRYSREDMERMRNSLKSRMQDKDKEIEQLRKQLVTKRTTAADTSFQEMEQRCKGLTQSLIQKQTLIEQLSSERHSLALQLERSDARLRHVLEDSRSQMASPSVSIGISNSSSSSNLINRTGNKTFFDDDPYDGRVTRRVKRVYGQFDAFSVRIGQFLRAYPPARAFILVYILFLHLWVFVVLFSYRPEIHELDP